MGVQPAYRQRCLFGLGTATGLAIIGLFYLSKYNETITEAERPSAVLPVFYRDVRPDINQFNIYQIETSSSDKLRPRFICSMESFCALNPTAVVWLLVTAPVLQTTTMEDLEAVQAVHQNLKVAYAEFNLVLQDTPLLELYKSAKFWDTDFVMIQLSDVARLAVVYKSGGFYADTDILAVRPVGHLSNFFALQSESVINNAVFHFQRGHPMLLAVMKHIAANYNGHQWGAQGPYGVTATAKAAGCPSTLSEAKNKSSDTPVQHCSQSTPLTASGKEHKKNETLVCDWTLMEKTSFYPVHWQDSSSLFVSSSDGKSKQPVEEIFPESCGVHMSNKLTSEESFKEESLALKLARSSCRTTISRNGLL